MFAYRNESKLSRLVVRSTIVALALALVGAISTPRAHAAAAIVTGNGPLKGTSIFGV
jgi:hypothetical protein